MADDSVESPGQIPTNLRLLVLVEEVAKAGAPVTPTKVNEVLGLPKPSLHRLFTTAEAEGFLQRDVDGRSYSPGPRARRLAIDTISSERIRTVRVAILKALAVQVEETCNLAIPEREGMFYLDRVETHWPLRIQLPIGTEVPFHCTASGKLYLSSMRSDYLDRFLKNHRMDKLTEKTITDPDLLKTELEGIRARGYATDDEEFMEGMTAIAVPVRDSRGRLLSTLSIHAPEQRKTIDDLVEVLVPLRETAAQLAELLER